jgi:hypothetical protein
MKSEDGDETRRNESLASMAARDDARSDGEYEAKSYDVGKAVG